MKLLLATTIAAIALATAPSFAQSASGGSTLGSPTVPGTVRTDPPAISGAPAESNDPGANATADSSASAPAPTDNAPIRESDLTNETAKNPPAPSLKPWAPTTTGGLAAKAPPQ